MKEIERFERLKEMSYTYDAETGDIFGIKGKVLKRKGKNGYIYLGFYIGDKSYNIYGHRFCYWFYHGVVPENIDHINRVRDDNRISNLRSVSKQQNHFNRTDTKGYYYNKPRGKYQAYIMLNQKHISLGCYETETEAHAVYLAAKKIYHII
jgi:hypothetical protein